MLPLREEVGALCHSLAAPFLPSEFPQSCVRQGFCWLQPGQLKWAPPPPPVLSSSSPTPNRSSVCQLLRSYFPQPIPQALEHHQSETAEQATRLPNAEERACRGLPKEPSPAPDCCNLLVTSPSQTELHLKTREVSTTRWPSPPRPAGCSQLRWLSQLGNSLQLST